MSAPEEAAYIRKKNEIICLATTAFDDPFTRKQQLMTRFNDCEIAYVNPPHTMISRFKDKSIKRSKQRFYKATENITVWNPPSLFPFYNMFRSVNGLNQHMIVLPFIHKIALAHSFLNPVLWVYSPMYADVVKYVSKSALIYDCVDRHSAYTGFIRTSVVDKMEADLCRRCDMVFSTASGLYDRLLPFNESTHLVPNGADYGLFSQAQAKGIFVPDDLQGIHGPILGYVGHIRDWIDLDLLARLAKERPNYQLVLIGPTGPGISLDALNSLPNVHYLGAKKQTELPAYIAAFSACLNPFCKSDLSKDVSPLKFYEYLATGKPIVSTKYPKQVEEYADVTYIANNADEFISLCDAAVAVQPADRTAKQIEYAKACSWDARVAEIRRLLAQKDILTAPPLTEEEKKKAQEE